MKFEIHPKVVMLNVWTIKKDGMEGRTELHKQSPDLGAMWVFVLEAESTEWLVL